MRMPLRHRLAASLSALALLMAGCAAIDGRADKVLDTEAWEVRTTDFLYLPEGAIQVGQGHNRDRMGGVDTEVVLLKYEELTPSALQRWTKEQERVASATERKLTQKSLPEGATVAGLSVSDGSYHCFASERVNGQFSTADTVELIPFEDDAGDTYLFISRSAGRWGCADAELEDLIAQAKRREEINQAVVDAFKRIMNSPTMCAFSLGAVGADAEDVYEVCNARM